MKKRKAPKQTEHYKADYKEATPKQVAQAILKYRPVQRESPSSGKGEPKQKPRAGTAGLEPANIV